jgi:perosamine synthetase
MTSTATQSKPSAADAIIAAVAQVVGNASRPLSLHEPWFGGNEKAYVQSCIDDGWVSTAGPFVERFERELAAYCGARYAVAVVNGTCALHAALAVMGVKPGDEVLVPSLTFVATANAVMQAGAVPHFVDVETQSLGVDPVALDAYLMHIATTKSGACINKITGRIIRALVPVHVFGHPCQIEALRKVAAQYNLALVEDATEALGSAAHGKKVGADGVAVFSFNGNKIITTGGGGAIVTSDEALYRRLKHLTSTARTPHAWNIAHDEVAWNYRLPNLNAALGCAQLEQMPRFVAAKRALAARYIDAFAAVPGVHVLREPKGSESNYWLVTLLADTPDAVWLNATLQALHDAGLLCRPLWTPLHQLPMYTDCPRSALAITENLAARIISLPSGAKLGMAHG